MNVSKENPLNFNVLTTRDKSFLNINYYFKNNFEEEVEYIKCGKVNKVVDIC